MPSCYTEKRIDGLILATVSHEAPWLDLYKRGKIPVLFFDNDPNLRDVCNLVLLDNIRAGQMAVEHLYEQGHRNIAVICGNPVGNDRHQTCRGLPFGHAGQAAADW